MKRDEILASFRAAIEDCLATGVTVTELADEFKVSISAIGRWRSGRSEPVSYVCQEISRRICSKHHGYEKDCKLCNTHPRDLLPGWDKKVTEAEVAGSTICKKCGFEYYLTVDSCPKCGMEMEK